MLIPRPTRRALLKVVCGTAALAFVAATCKDLTGPTGIATDGTSTVSIAYLGPRDANGVVQLIAGNRISPPVEIRIGGVVATRARYVFSVGDTSVLRVSQHGDTIIAVGRGRDTVTVTVMGATVGGTFDSTRIAIKTRVPVAVRPERNLVTTSPIPTFSSLGDTATITAESQGSDGKRTRPGKVRWYSANPAVFTADSLGVSRPDSSSTTRVTAVGNGTAVNLLTVFDDIDTVLTPITVQQTLAKYFLSSRFGPGTQIDFRSLGDTATVVATPRDARGNAFVAGAQPAPAPSFGIAPLGKVSINPTSGLLTANANTDPGSPVLLTATAGGTTSDPLPVTVQQIATSITIIGKRIDTIPSIGSTKDLIAIVRDARGNDIQTGITWTSRNTTVVQFRTSSSGDFALAIDTGTTRMVVSRDQVADSIVITVTNSPETVVLQPDTLFIRSVNDIKRFTTIVVKNAKGDALVNIPITWSSADPTIVQARPDSTMRAVAVGATNVTATTPNGRTATSRVVVTNAPAFLDILPGSHTFASVGDTLLNIAIDFKNGLGAPLPRSSATWSSTDVNIATVNVDPTGNVRIIAAGTGNAYIRAVSPVDPLVRDSVFVTVTNAPASIVAAPNPAPTITAFGQTVTFTATVFNASGNPIPTAKLRWSVVTGAAFVSIDSVTGVATGLANGSATVRATSSGITTDVPITVAQAIAGTRSTITPGAASLVANGTSQTTITVQLKDANDNNIAFGGSTVVLTTSLGTLAPLPPTDNGNGRYTTTLTTGVTSGSASITGTANGSAITNSGIVAFTAGPANKYIVTPNNFTPPAGGAVTVRAQLADANNNPITTSGTVVQFTSTNGGSFTPGTGQATTDVAGVATITFTTSTTVSSHTITAATGAITGSSAAITSVAGTATKYIVTPSSTSPAAGSTIQVFAQLADANNNVVAQAGRTAVWTHTGSGSFPGGATDNSLTNSSGVATINFTTSTTSGQTATVTATTGGLTGTSATITTIAGPGSQLFIAQAPTANPQSGVPFPTQPAIQLRDAAGNAVNLPNVNVSAFITAGGGTLGGLTTVQTNASGLATFLDLVITGTVGPRTLTFIANGFAATSSALTLIEGPPSLTTTTITASPTSIPADNAAQSTINVQVRDAAGNPLGAGLTVNLSTTLGSLTANPATHVGGGVYRATLTAGTTSGTANVTGVIVGTGAIADNALVSLTNIGATHYSVTGASGSVVVGSSVLITAQLRDALNNPVPTAGKAVVWTNPEAGGTFATSTSVTDANGRAQVSFTGVVAGVQTINAADNTGLAGSGSVTVNNPVPTLGSLAPTSGVRLGTTNVVFTGTGFIAGVSSVNVGAGITVNSTTVNSPNQITANITIAATAATGARTFSVTNSGPGGGTSGTQAFTVNNPLPTLASLAPVSGDRLQTLDVVFTGSGFITGISSVNVGAGITVNTTTVDSPTQITANITIGAGASTGPRLFSVTNAAPGGGTSATQSFDVTNPVPTLASVSPAAGVQGQTAMQVVLTGTGFVSGAVVTFSSPDITKNSTTIDSPTQITVSIDIAASATIGSVTVTVTNVAPGGGTSGTQAFDINAPVAPTLLSIAPSVADRLQTLNVVFTGTGFANGVSSIDAVPGITVNSTIVDSPTQITANITIDPAIALGAHSLTVTNFPAGGTSGAQTLTINNPSPTLTNLSPSAGNLLQTLNVVFTGSGFITGVSTVNVGAGITVNSVTVDSPTQITANITISALAGLGGRNFSVTNAGPGGGNSGNQTFTVNP